MSLSNEFNAVAAICARDITRFFRDWKSNIFMSIFFPAVFLGMLGSAIGQNMGAGLGYDFMQFVLLGMVAGLAIMFSANTVTGLVEERETGFTQEIFVSPVSRYSIIIGKMVGSSIISMVAVAATILIGIAIGINISLDGVGLILLVIPVVFLLGSAFGVLVSGIFSSSPKTAGQAVMMFMFPQLFLSGALIPVASSTGVIDVLVHLMPATYVVDLMRGVFYWGSPTYNQVVLYSPWIDLTVTVIISLGLFVAGTYLFARSERNR
ncbi:MAG TPA: ABC transporter permease [Methanomassiliicoccales archaeon]|jgi:ABC-2 type transport system permease protein